MKTHYSEALAQDAQRTLGISANRLDVKTSALAAALGRCTICNEPAANCEHTGSMAGASRGPAGVGYGPFSEIAAANSNPKALK